MHIQTNTRSHRQTHLPTPLTCTLAYIQIYSLSLSHTQIHTHTHLPTPLTYTLPYRHYALTHRYTHTQTHTHTHKHTTVTDIILTLLHLKQLQSMQIYQLLLSGLRPGKSSFSFTVQCQALLFLGGTWTSVLFAGWLLNVPATCKCISGMDLLRQLYVLPQRNRYSDQTFPLTQSQYTDTRPISPSIDLITPGAWQSSHWSANF